MFAGQFLMKRSQDAAALHTTCKVGWRLPWGDQYEERDGREGQLTKANRVRHGAYAQRSGSKEIW
jgi:hypothetical protein